MKFTTEQIQARKQAWFDSLRKKAEDDPIATQKNEAYIAERLNMMDKDIEDIISGRWTGTDYIPYFKKGLSDFKLCLTKKGDLPDNRLLYFDALEAVAAEKGHNITVNIEPFIYTINEFVLNPETLVKEYQDVPKGEGIRVIFEPCRRNLIIKH